MKKLLTRLIILSILLAMSQGCTPASTVVMYNPETKQTVECKRDPWKHWQWEDERVIQGCIRQYRAVGFVEADSWKASDALGAPISPRP